MRTKLDDSKKSLSGFFDDKHEIARFYNLVKSQSGSKQYLSSWGLDWKTWMSPDINFSRGALSSAVIQQATVNGIVVLDMSIDVTREHTMAISARIQGLTTSSESTSTYFNV
jgi:hypothetical protein